MVVDVAEVFPSKIFSSSVVICPPSNISSSDSLIEAEPITNVPPVIEPVVEIVELPISMLPNPLLIAPVSKYQQLLLEFVKHLHL